MLANILLLHVYICAVTANLSNTRVPLSCDKTSRDYTGCLSDQVCLGGEKCVPAPPLESPIPTDPPTAIMQTHRLPERGDFTTMRVARRMTTHPSPVPEKNQARDTIYPRDSTEPIIKTPPTDHEIPPAGPKPAPLNGDPGTFAVVGKSGVPVMHAALMPNGKVMFLDKVENYTQIKLGNGQYAYSAEYDPATNTAIGITYRTNAFCCGGTFLADGRLVSLGGNYGLEWLDPTVTEGLNAIRYLKRSSSDASFDGQSWEEPGHKLSTARWYASAQTLADGAVFVAAGSLNALDPNVASNNNPTYEMLDSQGFSYGGSHVMEILEKNQPYYMYPFLHLLRDGSLFVFVAKSAELFNVATGSAWRNLPDLSGYYRTYPNTGGSVLLPLSSTNNWEPDIVVCGGGKEVAIASLTDASCGRIQPLSPNAQWELDYMPEGRGMVEGTLLADGTVIWLNGAKSGAQGFHQAKDPAFEALIYEPTKPHGNRWTSGASSYIPRLYHSVALLMLDGTVMVAGSNPNEMPILEFTTQGAEDFVTDFRVEIYTPPYLQGDKANQRPKDIVLSSKTLSADSSWFEIQYTIPPWTKKVEVALYHGGFSTHSLHMGQRMMWLDIFWGWGEDISPELRRETIKVQMPPNGNVAPPGPYVVYVLADRVPGIGQFVVVG